MIRASKKEEEGNYAIRYKKNAILAQNNLISQQMEELKNHMTKICRMEHLHKIHLSR